MISAIRATAIMDQLMRRAAVFIRRNGFLSPMVCAMQPGRPFADDYDHPRAIRTRTDNENEGIAGYYRLVVLLRMRDETDYGNTGTVAREIAQRTDAEAIGSIVTVLHREHDNGRESHADLETDPDALSVVNMCLYLKGRRQPLLTQVPYLLRGTAPNPIDPSAEPEHDVTFVYSVWGENNRRTVPSFAYPF